jgi:hypothetical protein
LIEIATIRCLETAGKNAQILEHLYNQRERGVKEMVVVGEGRQKLDFIIPEFEERIKGDIIVLQKSFKVGSPES